MSTGDRPIFAPPTSPVLSRDGRNATGRRIAVRIARAVMRVGTAGRGLLASLLLAPLLALNRHLFDAGHYRAVYGQTALARRAPFLDFVLRGARQLRDPSPAFSQRDYAREKPWLLSYPPVLHYLLYGRYEMRELVSPVLPATVAESPADLRLATEPAPNAAAVPESLDTPHDVFGRLWPQLRADMIGLSDVAHQLSPVAHVQHRLAGAIVNAPPSHVGGASRAVLAALPARVDHLLILPWLGISGGSEKVSQRLLQLLVAHYGDSRVCVLAPDSVFDLGPDQRRRYGLPIVAINDTHPHLGLAARAEVVDRVLISLRPRTVHTINSDAGWFAFRDQGRHYAQDCRLFGNIYSDIRIGDGIPAGVFWHFLPRTVDDLAGVFADNREVVDRAIRNFGFLPDQAARHVVVPTPIVGLGGGDAQGDLRRHRNPGLRHTLWMSRIAPEKRIDIIRDVARRCPGRLFSIYGAVIPGASPVDMGWLRETPNVRYHGEFATFADLPLDSFDSYIFTTSAEGMPIALLEAAMLGLPTVAPRIGGIGEFIDETTGWLVGAAGNPDEYAAALDEIGSHPAEAGRRVEAAQRRLVERHSWQNYRRVVGDVPGYLH